MAGHLLVGFWYTRRKTGIPLGWHLISSSPWPLPLKVRPDLLPNIKLHLKPLDARGTSQASGSSLGCRLTETTSDKGFPDVAQLTPTQSAPEADSNFLCMYFFPLHQKHFLLKAGGRSIKSQELMKRTRHRLLSWVELSFVISSLPDSPPGKTTHCLIQQFPEFPPWRTA